MRYAELKNLEESNRNTLLSMFIGILSDIKNTSTRKMTDIIKDIPAICRMNYI